MFDRDEMLAAFRERRGPSEETVERIADRLEALGPTRARGTVIELAPRRRMGRSTRLAIAVGALAAAALLGWWIRGVTLTPATEAYGSLAEDRVEQDAGGGIAKAGGDAKVRRAAPAPVDEIEAATPPEIEAAPPPEAEAAVAIEPVTPRGAPRARAPRVRADPPPPIVEAPAPAATPAPAPKQDTLAEETAIVRRARAQLSRGRAQQALAIVGEHADRFPSGALVEEAAAVRTMAQCRLRVSEAARLGAAFVDRFPNSLFRSQVDAACRATEKTEPE